MSTDTIEFWQESTPTSLAERFTRIQTLARVSVSIRHSAAAADPAEGCPHSCSGGSHQCGVHQLAGTSRGSGKRRYPSTRSLHSFVQTADQQCFYIHPLTCFMSCRYLNSWIIETLRRMSLRNKEACKAWYKHQAAFVCYTVQLPEECLFTLILCSFDSVQHWLVGKGHVVFNFLDSRL